MSQDHDSREDGSVTHFFRRVKCGEAAAAEMLWERYFPRLLSLARKTLGGRYQSTMEPEDIVQSAFLSFWKRASVGDFSEWVTRNEIWNLLAKITVRKVYQFVRHEEAGIRGGGKVLNEVDLPNQSLMTSPLDEAVATLPTAELDLCCEEYLMALDDETRSVVVLKMMGHKNLEISELLRFTETKVERKLRIARKTWKLDHDPDTEDDSSNNP